MGQIPQALVVQFSELKLDDLIGAGAEGKVRRPVGTADTHTRLRVCIACYSPYKPAEASGSSHLVALAALGLLSEQRVWSLA